jgi:hypothetical protein
VTTKTSEELINTNNRTTLVGGGPAVAARRGRKGIGRTTRWGGSGCVTGKEQLRTALGRAGSRASRVTQRWLRAGPGRRRADRSDRNEWIGMSGIRAIETSG